jgi:hypothetical protein
MAKKTAKKAAAKPVKKGAKSAAKPAGKPAKKVAKAAAKKPAAKSAGGSGAGVGGGAPGPFEVKTGSGASAMEIGQDLVAMFNRGEFKQIEDKYWSPGIESIEGLGVNMGWRGRKAAEEKGAAWMAEHTIHGATAEGPFVGSTGFTVRFKMDVETKADGKRSMMDEVGVYTVRDGKIVREEFMYSLS